MKAASTVLFGLLALAGCGRLVSIDYEATNVVKGEGVVRVTPFQYEPFEAHRVRPRQIETDPNSKTDLFMVQDIASFFTEAATKELLKSGYTIDDSAERVMTGTLRQFSFDYSSSQTDRSFRLSVDYAVSREGQSSFLWQCTSVQHAPNQMGSDGPLIRKGIGDCMQRFLEAAQDAKVL